MINFLDPGIRRIDQSGGGRSGGRGREGSGAGRPGQILLSQPRQPFFQVSHLFTPARLVLHALRPCFAWPMLRPLFPFFSSLHFMGSASPSCFPNTGAPPTQAVDFVILCNEPGPPSELHNIRPASFWCFLLFRSSFVFFSCNQFYHCQRSSQQFTDPPIGATILSLAFFILLSKSASIFRLCCCLTSSLHLFHLPACTCFAADCIL